MAVPLAFVVFESRGHRDVTGPEGSIDLARITLHRRDNLVRFTGRTARRPGALIGRWTPANREQEQCPDPPAEQPWRIYDGKSPTHSASPASTAATPASST